MLYVPLLEMMPTGWTPRGHMAARDGDRKVLDYLEIDTRNKRLTVFNAQNAFDLTKPRLKMREVLRECWTITGLKTNELKEIKGSMVQNDDMKKALADCRKTMKLGAVAPFAVSAADKTNAQKACWTRIGKTIFVASIKGAIASFDIKKKLLKVEVENSWQGDNILFTFIMNRPTTKTMDDQDEQKDQHLCP
ncbi:hypothetical protein CGGC5_v010286 [Colletotrichum fructicola Nara gc5]|uniref:Uncharacterized protein n=1 Tax=Colletotrichum fructicola (strain Nara gc5) TaxID=1213859 RepID=A0A7J6IN97_COLFN|nr:hypothetical protein CGGC5_v013041 [Colletotrichum fructicola Nara gc5]KAF4481486.1 hypothetical protein CGGC5_v010286 [Colletotrichum fructicola Nara gc5]